MLTFWSGSQTYSEPNFIQLRNSVTEKLCLLTVAENRANLKPISRPRCANAHVHGDLYCCTTNLSKSRLWSLQALSCAYSLGSRRCYSLKRDEPLQEGAIRSGTAVTSTHELLSKTLESGWCATSVRSWKRPLASDVRAFNINQQRLEPRLLCLPLTVSTKWTVWVVSAENRALSSTQSFISGPV